MAKVSSNALRGTNYQENRLKYNGKELQNKEFVGGSGLELYDYGARLQDPQIGRFMSVDPKSEKFVRYSPYSYTNNNPVLFTDPNGEEIWIYYGEDQKNKVRYDNGKVYNADGSKYKGKDQFVNTVFKALIN
jgi:RHS repeat-associated protein